MKPPSFPKEMTVTTLSEDSLRSHEEYNAVRFKGGHRIDQQVDALVLQQVQFQAANLDGSSLYAPKLSDVRLSECSLANTSCERLIAHRTEFIGCRLVGLAIADGYLQDVLFRECDLQLASLRFCTFKTVRFERCNLRGVNFQGADLSGVRFTRCDLSNAQLSQAKLQGTDFRTSLIEGLKVGAQEVVGAVVDPIQAAYMASLLGLVIKHQDEE